MKIIICDVGDAACNIIVSPNGYVMMIDCGCCNHKQNPIETINNTQKWHGAIEYVTKDLKRYPLGLLHISHPDDDHVRNAKRIKKELTPYLLIRQYCEDYDDLNCINSDYKNEIDSHYRGSNPEYIDWGFDCNETFQIPLDIVKTNINLSSKVRNNSSIIRYIRHNGVGVLFGGDLECSAWDWLIENDSSFVYAVNNGIDILIAPHHGHKSGFPKALFDLIGKVEIVVHSKDTEAEKESTDVSSQYTNYATGHWYWNLNESKDLYYGKVLTTRSNGNIFISASEDNPTKYTVWCDKASGNHAKLNV